MPNGQTLDELQAGDYTLEPARQLRPFRRGGEGKLTRGAEIVGEALGRSLLALPRAARGMVEAAAYDEANPGEFTLGEAGGRFGSEAVQTMIGGVPGRGSGAVLRSASGPAWVGPKATVATPATNPAAAFTKPPSASPNLDALWAKTSPGLKHISDEEFHALSPVQKLNALDTAEKTAASYKDKIKPTEVDAEAVFAKLKELAGKAPGASPPKLKPLPPTAGSAKSEAALFKDYAKMDDTYKGYSNDEFAGLTYAQKVEEYNVAEALMYSHQKKMSNKTPPSTTFSSMDNAKLEEMAKSPYQNAKTREEAGKELALRHTRETDKLPSLTPEERESARLAGGYTTKAYRGVSGQSERRVHPRGYEYFSTDDPGLAARYAGEDLYDTLGKGPRVQPLRINTKDYLDFDAKGAQWSTAQAEAFPIANEQGKKGVILRNVYDEPTGTGKNRAPTTVYVTFDPKTRKSQFARRFDPESPDILRGTTVGRGIPLSDLRAVAPRDKEDKK